MIGIVIIEDQEATRLGLQHLLDATDGYEVVGTAASGEEALPLVASRRPDICLLDLRLPGLSGPALIRSIRDASATTKPVVITAYDDDARILGCLAAGAFGYLSKGTEYERLVRALSLIVSGAMVSDFPSALAAAAAESLYGTAREPAGLTAAERRILALVGRGLTNREIAELLGVGEQTVKNHMRAIMQKLGVRNRAAAALAAKDRGAS